MTKSLRKLARRAQRKVLHQMQRLLNETSQVATKVVRRAASRNPGARRLSHLLPSAVRREVEQVWLLRESSLFDHEWYLAQNPELRAKGKDPFLHYLRSGAARGLDPNPWFATDWYLLQYPDVQLAGINPLVHYILFGIREHRMPHPNFDPEYYLSCHPEAAASPLEHFLKEGLLRGWKTRAIGNVQDHLPVQPRERETGSSTVKINIVVPVYRGYDETRACLISVVRSLDRSCHRLVVVDDCSPDPQLSEWIRQFAAEHDVEVIYNPTNLGFVATVNRGMRSADRDADVVLLNSDTLVPSGWLQRLAAQAHKDPVIGTVTPFSNNATICSYPDPRGGPLPAGFGVRDLDAACRSANAERSVDIPTAVGFCMYIRRECLDQVGLFDVETFGRGYGEENDFCLRASHLGWRHLLACDVFVYHSGEVSFGANSPERATAWDALVRRYPDYPALIGRFGRLNPAAPYRFAATAQLLRDRKEPKILLLTHRKGGGVERHIDDLVSQSDAHFLVLQPRGNDVELSIPAFRGHPSLVLSCDDIDDLAKVVHSIDVSFVHVHHIIDFHMNMELLLQKLKVPVDLTIHDYYFICPQITLLHDGYHYCGEPGMADCNACIARRPSHGALDILSWRKGHEWLFRRARRIICPSRDVQRRLERYGADGRMLVVPHEATTDPSWPLRVQPPGPSEPLRVAVLGVLAPYKGAAIFTHCVALDSDERIAFAIVGKAQPPLPAHLAARVTETGKYREDELQELIERLDPHVIWFPAPWPETYSYTLSAAISSGRPIVASRIGAFPERLAGRPWTWLVDASAPAREWLSTLDDIRSSLVRNSSPEVGILRPTDREDFYRTSYLIAADQKPPALIDLRSDDRISLVILPEKHDGRWSSCAYMRLLLPATHPDLADALRVSVVENVAEALYYRADVILTQRTAVDDVEDTQALIEHARHSGARLIYDLDENLLALDSEDVDQVAIERRQAPIMLLLGEADLVTASTAPLQSLLQQYNPHVQLLENVLDDRLWREPPEAPDDSVVRVLYMGTAEHGQDLALIADACRDIKAEFGRKISFEIVGAISEDVFGDWGQRIVPSSHASLSYPGFVHWLRAQRRWHIGVAPLVDSPPTRCKSGIEALHYAGLGLAVAASDVLPYQSAIMHGQTGLLVPSTRDGWRDSLRLLGRDRPLRHRLATEAHRRLFRSPCVPSAGKAWLGSLTRSASTS